MLPLRSYTQPTFPDGIRNATTTSVAPIDPAVPRDETKPIRSSDAKRAKSKWRAIRGASLAAVMSRTNCVRFEQPRTRYLKQGALGR